MEEEEDDFFAASNSPVAFGAMLKRSARDRELHEQLCAEVGSEDDEEESIPVKRIKTDASKEILKASDKKPSSSSDSSHDSSPDIKHTSTYIHNDPETQKLLEEVDFALYKYNYKKDPSFNTSSSSHNDSDLQYSFGDNILTIQNNLTLRIRCKSQIYRYTIAENEQLSLIVDKLATELNCISDQIILQFNLMDISSKCTPKDLNLSPTDILDAYIIDKTSSKASSNRIPTANLLKIKIQTSKNSVIYEIDKTQSLDFVFEKFAKEMNFTYSTMKFYFDGEKINSKQTPEDLDMENNDVIDAK